MKEILFAPPPQKGIFTLWTRFSVYYFYLFWSNLTFLSFWNSSLIYSHSVATLKLLLIWKQFYNFGLFSYAVFNSLFIQNHFYDFFYWINACHNIFLFRINHIFLFWSNSTNIVSSFFQKMQLKSFLPHNKTKLPCHFGSAAFICI